MHQQELAALIRNSELPHEMLQIHSTNFEQAINVMETHKHIMAVVKYHKRSLNIAMVNVSFEAAAS